LRLNQFSDLSNEEFSDKYLSKDISSLGDFTCSGPQAPHKDAFNETYNIDSSNYLFNLEIINPTVGNQGNCASGYAFATTAAVESSKYLIFKQMTPMSVQQLVDCTK
jgi:hypothetical protein